MHVLSLASCAVVCSWSAAAPAFHLSVSPRMDRAVSPRMDGVGATSGAGSARASGSTPIALSYGAAAGVLMAVSLGGSVAFERAVLGATGFALLCDFGPSASRDVAASNRATALAVDDLIEASPAAVLVDNFVHNLGAEDEAQREARAQAQAKLRACQNWACFVRSRVAADAAGAALMLRNGGACLGASCMLAAHAACWACGYAASRVDRDGNTAPISPPLARTLAAVVGTLTGAAAMGAFAGSELLRAIGGWGYAAALVAIELARLVADRVRSRTHVGL
mmetsp:Transcript_7912/g.25392  ORF Transcript_7912/g.25392 Transcript_7912/m.25392 type:complete len:280 (-) Transcript_7912:196-1035(-)